MGAKASQQVGAAARKTLTFLGGEDPVCAERAKVEPKLAPSAQHPRAVHEAENDWPNNALRTPLLFIAIDNGKAGLRADCGAQS